MYIWESNFNALQILPKAIFLDFFVNALFIAELKNTGM